MIRVHFDCDSCGQAITVPPGSVLDVPAGWATVKVAAGATGRVAEIAEICPDCVKQLTLSTATGSEAPA